ncbi:OsmC family peroxiredoxin [Solicola sp. PLA-1-18]|jgi:osmotically inducible protein OsmC|uniref:OsmC family peroxiredoxin n=1 Tax=Solicola sp. PLA-1-18 TaxID=3380532 RepID=UPI003B801100
MPARHASTTWTGDIESGSGHVTLDDSKAGEFTISYPSRANDAASEQTNPEELIAAAHSGCFAMNLAGHLKQADLTADQLAVTSKVTLKQVDGGLAITDIALTLQASIPGVDDARFQEIAAEAERTCPVSKVLAAATITLSATLV